MEASRIRIPERYQLGIAKLISLPENALEELLSILNEIPTSLNLDSLKEYCVSRISSIREQDVDEIISALDSLYYLKNEFDSSSEDFSDQILRAMDETGNKALKIDASLRESFRDRLIRLMNGKLLSIAVRSREVLYEQERTFGSARILSDIRSIFGGASENNPDAAIIVHTLKIHYIQNNEHKEFFVTLDTEDISFMIDTLIRAQEKEESLKSILTAANVPYIDAE
jgi:hypothetical protein